MFESVVEDPAQKAVRKLALMFDVLAVLAGLAIVYGIVLRVSGDPRMGVFYFAWNGGYAALSLFTARGIASRREWAPILAWLIALISLLNVPVGTIIGIVVIVYLRRAGKAGLLSAPPTSGAGSAE